MCSCCREFIRPVRAAVTYGGVRDLGGTPVHVVTAAFPPNRQPTSGIASQTLTAFYDTATLLPRRVQWVSLRADGLTIENSVEYDDYREVQGMQVAYRRRMMIRGLRATLPPARIAEARRREDVLRANLPRMPEADRAESQQALQMLEHYLETDELVSELTVTAAAVNEGIPPGAPVRRLGSPPPS